MRFRRRTRVALVDLSPEVREQWRRYHAEPPNVATPEGPGPHSCPCCGHLTLPARGKYELCGECNWEDEGQDDHDSHVARLLGPNGGESLDDARQRYGERGGSPLPHHAPAAPQ